MTYNPINNIIFSAAYSSVTSGLFNSRNITIDSNAISNGIKIATAFAIAIDNSWNSAAVPTLNQIFAIGQLCQGYFQDRFPIIDSDNINSSFWNDEAQSIVTIVLASDVNLAAISVTSPLWPGGI